jgi:hypothetical protein
MSKILESARRNVSRLSASFTKKEAQLATTKERMAERMRKAEEAVLKAQERLDKVRTEAERLTAKRTEELERTKEASCKAEERFAEISARPPKTVTPAGTVETETGEVRPLSKAAVETIKRVIGRSRKGTLQPLDGAEAQAVLTSLDAGGNVGDVFEVRIKGRKTVLMFSVEADGLRYETVSSACSVA